jgi:RNA polymerase sigma factor (sigma-70 family)
MTGGQRTSLFSYLRTHTALLEETRHSSDSELLHRFTDQRDEAAFAALVRRHGAMVLGVCRRVLHHSHDAEDAFQATFFVLARKAASVRWQDSIAGWLQQTAYHLALRTRTAAVRRRTHEGAAQPASPTDHLAEITLREFQQVLDEELARLPEKYRAPLVLCCLEGATRDEAAQRLGCTTQTLKSRLEQGRERLRKRLERRGVTLAAALGCVTLASGTAAAIAPPLVDATTTAALLFASGQAAAISGSATAVLLAKDTLKTPLKKLVLVLLSLAVLGTGSALLANWMQAEAEKEPPQVSAVEVKEAPPAIEQRIVFAGDSSTDGNTYLLLIRQALAEAGQPVPGVVNAGVSTDMMRGVRLRLERDVFVHRPTLVAVSAGTFDAIHEVAPADYEADVRAIAAQLRDKGIPLLLLTTGLLGGEQAKAEPRLMEYNAILCRLAGEFGCRVADVNRLLREARAAGQVMVEKDNVHPNFQATRLIARAVLDALGHTEVPVPKELSVSRMPGILTKWRVRIAPPGQILDEKLVARLEPEKAGWSDYTLPEPGPASTWWLEQDRKRGFALSLDKRLGKVKVYQGVSWFQAARPRSAFLHTGAALHSVWLNGQRVYRCKGWTGWHAGKERIRVQMRAGRNVVVIETGSDFFLSITDSAVLPQERQEPGQQGKGT